jgi:hypothetical protein
MSVFGRGQPPARHTKVVDTNLCPLKSGPTRLSVPVCANDATSSKPTTLGRAVADVPLIIVLFVIVVLFDVKLVNIYIRAEHL